MSEIVDGQANLFRRYSCSKVCTDGRTNPSHIMACCKSIRSLPPGNSFSVKKVINFLTRSLRIYNNNLRKSRDSPPFLRTDFQDHWPFGFRENFQRFVSFRFSPT